MGPKPQPLAVPTCLELVALVHHDLPVYRDRGGHVVRLGPVLDPWRGGVEHPSVYRVRGVDVDVPPIGGVGRPV